MISGQRNHAAESPKSVNTPKTLQHKVLYMNSCRNNTKPKKSKSQCSIKHGPYKPTNELLAIYF